MSRSKFTLLPELVAAGFLAAAQPSPGSPSPPGPQEETRWPTAKGRSAEARQTAALPIEDAEPTGSAPAYQAGLGHLPGVEENRPGRYKEAESALGRGVLLCDRSRRASTGLVLALSVDPRGAQGDDREAGIPAEQALQMSRAIPGPEHPVLVAQMCGHALPLKATPRRKDAYTPKRVADRIRALKGYWEPGRHRVDIPVLRECYRGDGGRYALGSYRGLYGVASTGPLTC